MHERNAIDPPGPTGPSLPQLVMDHLSTPLLVIEQGRDGCALLVALNPAAARWLGLADEGVTGLPLSQLRGGPRLEALRPWLTDALAAAAPVVWRSGAGDGIAIDPLPAGEGGGRRLLVTLREPAPAGAEQPAAPPGQTGMRWRTLMDNLPGPVIRFDCQGRQLYANPAALNAWGATGAEGLGRPLPGFDSAGRALADVVRQVAATGVAEVSGVSRPTPAGPRHFSLRYLPERDGAGAVVGVLGIATDVTELVESRQALRSERAVFMRGPTVIFKWQAAPGWPVEYVSPNVLDQLGYRPEAFTSGELPFASLIHPDDLARVAAEVAAGAAAGSAFNQLYRLRHADGRYRLVQDYTSVIYDAEGVPTGYFGYLIDVTDLKRSEERLRLLNFALDHVREEAYLIDEQARFEYVNDGAVNALGYSREELLRMRVEEIDPDFPGSRWPSHLQHLKQGGRMVFEGRHRARDGRIYPVEISANYFEYEGSGYILALARDISERREAEQGLTRLNRALKTLSCGNEALVRAVEEGELLAQMCRVLVEVGGYPLAWIGLPTAEGRVAPRAWAGEEAGFLAVREQFCEEDPAVKAVESGEPQLVRDLASAGGEACREELCRRGLCACIAFPLQLNHSGCGVLALYAGDPLAFDMEEALLLSEMANDLAYGIRALRARADRERFLERLRASMQSTIQALSNTVELRDPYTAGHQRRVAALAAAVARRLGWPEERIEVIELSALVHDIGKIAVPSEILSRPGRLSTAELALVRTHAESGYEILKGVDFPWPIADYVRQHHERLDGSGYPLGLKGEEIAPEARVLAVCDVVEAMTTHRPYRPGLGIDAALAEVVHMQGILFEPAVVEVCVRLFREEGFQFG